MNCPKYTLDLILIVVFAAGTVRTWDNFEYRKPMHLAVVTPSKIQFLTQKPVKNMADDMLKAMSAIAYNAIKKDIYVSDSNQNIGSIFRIKTTGKEAYNVVEPIIAKQSSTVQGMAFDDRTSTLYWTAGSGRTIKYAKVPEEDAIKFPLEEHVLKKFSNKIPQGIAIDTCRGYLYFTNCNHLNATIERLSLDGSDSKVMVQDNLFQPLGVAVDVEQNILYWSNELEGIYYTIEKIDMNSGNRSLVMQGTHHQPFAIALNEQNIYWSDWTNNVVWTLPKYTTQGSNQPKMVASYENIETPMGLITPMGNTSLVNNTECKVHKTKEIVTTTELTPEMIPLKVLRNMCKNNGVLHANGTCTCAPGFQGDYCQTDVCSGYCLSGTCSIDNAGQPKCDCPKTTYGDKCDKQLCEIRCQNGGKCILDTDSNPQCECLFGYVGDECQHQEPYLHKLCSVYCENVPISKSEQSPYCSCDDYKSKYDYAELEMSPCKLSKSMVVVIAVLLVFVASLGTITIVLARRVRALGRRPRIKKRIVVNKSITPLQTCRPPQQQNQQCEITIENCCNMNICETPCFEPDYRPPKLGGGLLSLGRSKKEDKTNLLSNTDMSSEDEKPSY